MKKFNVAVEKERQRVQSILIYIFILTNICLAEFNRNLEQSSLDLRNKSQALVKCTFRPLGTLTNTSSKKYILTHFQKLHVF